MTEKDGEKVMFNHRGFMTQVEGDKLRQENKELRTRVAEFGRELVIARQTHFQREKSLEKRLQLMGEKLKEWQHGKCNCGMKVCVLCNPTGKGTAFEGSNLREGGIASRPALKSEDVLGIHTSPAHEEFKTATQSGYVQELQNRLSTLEKEIEIQKNTHSAIEKDLVSRLNENIRKFAPYKEWPDPLQEKYDTLLKASEGLEKALNGWIKSYPNDADEFETAKLALADFRAVKEKNVQ